MKKEFYHISRIINTFVLTFFIRYMRYKVFSWFGLWKSSSVIGCQTWISRPGAPVRFFRAAFSEIHSQCVYRLYCFILECSQPSFLVFSSIFERGKRTTRELEASAEREARGWNSRWLCSLFSLTRVLLHQKIERLWTVWVHIIKCDRWMQFK